MYPAPNPLRRKLAAGECITGLYIQTASPDSVEIAAAAGFDYAILDQEHGPFGHGATVELIRAAEATGICPVVRVPDHGAAGLRKAVEAGAMGVYVPDVRTAGQAAAAVAAVRFRVGENGGMRGACPTVRAARARGAAEWEQYVAWSNANILVTLLIESEQGLADLDAILAVPGVDMVALGRFDLAHEMGLNGDRYGTAISGIFETFVARAEQAGVPYVTRLRPAEPAAMRRERQAWVARGARNFTMGSDREFMAKAFGAALAPMRD
ncbi:HpcH/HpaI aldolase family protein [Cupriavidus sp. 30B13]|uniref:HpcH/HpaI aldolase family protein n=1 Tax=Cupriavidus sp. 30B13 TaxID=3384241 RepID=UPI003B8FD57C